MAVGLRLSFHETCVADLPTVSEMCSSRTHTFRITSARTRSALRNSFKSFVLATKIPTWGVCTVVLRPGLTRSSPWLPISAAQLPTIFSGGRVFFNHSVPIIYCHDVDASSIRSTVKWTILTAVFTAHLLNISWCRGFWKFPMDIEAARGFAVQTADT